MNDAAKICDLWSESQHVERCSGACQLRRRERRSLNGNADILCRSADEDLSDLNSIFACVNVKRFFPISRLIMVQPIRCESPRKREQKDAKSNLSICNRAPQRDLADCAKRNSLDGDCNLFSAESFCADLLNLQGRQGFLRHLPARSSTD